MSGSPHLYVIALGCNQPVRRMSPRNVVDAALDSLDALSDGPILCSRIVESAPLGPSRRRYANAVILMEFSDAPPALLAQLQAIESHFGRKRRGQRWGARPLDLDIILWSGGIWSDAALAVPHVAFRLRDFVLGPLAHIAPSWRDPVTGLTVRQLLVRHRKRKPVDRIAKPL